MKNIIVGLAICVSAVASGASSSFLLETETSEMAFRNANGTWLLDHYGAKGVSADDAAALAYRPGLARDNDGQRKNATLSVFGADTFDNCPNRYGGLAVTHADGNVSTELVDAGSEVKDGADGSRTLVLSLRDPAYAFEVRQFFRTRPDCDVFETWIELRNGEKGDVAISRMDSVALTLPLFTTGSLKLMTLTGDWGSEGGVSIADVPRGKTVSAGSRTGVREAWAANASFMLWKGDEATERQGEVLGGALCWSGSHRVSVERNTAQAVELRLGVDNVAGPYVLASGKTLVTPMAVLTWSNRGRGQVSRNLHRWARRYRLPHGLKTRDVLLNSWEGSYFSFTEKTLTDMMDGVRELGGELFVLDDGWFGRGPFARDDKNRDTVGLGDWVVNPEKLPRGFDYLSAEAKKRGLGFGLWVEPEMVNTKSELATQHPDWLLQEPNRRQRLGRGKTQTVLDYTNPAVTDNIFSQLDTLFASVPDLRYVKWDANANFNNFGCAGLPRDRQANLWFDYTAGLYGLLGRLREKHPDLVIQACSSGGGRMDYGFLGYADEFWASDDTDAHERVFIQWGASQFYPACAMASHVTGVPNHQTKRTTPFKFRFDVAMSGRLGFELHPKNLSADEIAFAKDAVATYKRLRGTIQQGELYRLASPYDGDHAALLYVSEDGSKAVVFVYGLVRRCSTGAVRIRLDGLDANGVYKIAETNRWKDAKPHVQVDGMSLSGAALMNVGLFVNLSATYDSCVLELTRP